MPDITLAGLAPDLSLEPRLRALLQELPPAQAAVLEEFWRERERLLALAEQHRLVMQAATDAILVTGVGGVVEYANEAARRLFAARRGLEGTRLPEVVARERDDEREQLRAYMDRALSGDAVRAECNVVDPDGDVRRVNVTMHPIREHGYVSGLVASFTDFTDEARARDEVAAANVRFRDVVDVAGDAIWTVDRGGLFTSVNPATLDLVGREQGELLGRSAIQLIAPEDQSSVAGYFRSVLGGKRERYQCRIIRSDGSRRSVSVVSSPIAMRGTVTGILGVVRDLADERLTSAAYARLAATHTRLVDSSEDAIATIDAEGRFTSVNRALENVSGRSRHELIGGNFVEILKPSERADLWRLFAATLGGERQRRELRFTRADGAVRIATVLATPLIEDGHVSGVLVIARDVTDERNLQAQLVRREKLVALGVTGSLNQQQEQALESTLARLLEFVRQHAAERLEADLNLVIEDSLGLRRQALRSQGIVLEVDLERDLPMTWADPTQLQQAFLSILGNAEQAVAQQPGERRIRVSTRRDGDRLVTTVTDSGPGIAPEHFPHIFNPFYSTKPRGTGTGLGLSIADGIVRAHDGTIRVRSEPGQGASFEVALPIVPPPASPSH